MVREALRERFLGALREMGGNAGNQRLREELDWQENTYWQVHAALIEEGAIIPGRGRGGSVSLAGGTKPHASPRPEDRKRLAALPSERREAVVRQKNGNGANVGYEAQLWQMAYALRGSMDAAEYKHVVLVLREPLYPAQNRTRGDSGIPLRESGFPSAGITARNPSSSPASSSPSTSRLAVSPKDNRALNDA